MSEQHDADEPRAEHRGRECICDARRQPDEFRNSRDAQVRWSDRCGVARDLNEREVGVEPSPENADTGDHDPGHEPSLDRGPLSLGDQPPSDREG